jgi:hypothetical protein
LAALDLKEACCRSTQNAAGEGSMKKMMEMIVILSAVEVVVVVVVSVAGRSSSQIEAVVASGALVGVDVTLLHQEVVDVTLLQQEVVNI